MKKIAILIITVIILGGCSFTKVSKRPADYQPEFEQSWKEQSALVAFSYSELARLEGDYSSSLNYLFIALEFDPESVFIKERVFGFLSLQANQDSLAAQKLIALGEKWYNEGSYSSKILFQLGTTCLRQGDIISAEKYMKESLSTDAEPQYYLTYYRFQKEYNPPADSLLLAKVIDKEWLDSDEFEIYQAAELYADEGDLNKAKDLFRRGYQRWDSLQMLLKLISLNQEFTNLNENVELLLDRYERKEDLPPRIVEYLISVLFERKDYNKIVKLEKACRETGNELIMKMLFLSALEVNDYELSYQIAELMITAGYIAEEFYPSVYGSLCEMEIEKENWEKAYINFHKIDKLINKLQVIYDYEILGEHSELLSKFLEFNYQNTEGKEQQEALYLLVIYNLEIGELERIPELLSLTDKSLFDDLKLMAAFANAYDSQTDWADEDFQVLKREFGESDLRLGKLFYYLDQSQLAENNLTQAWDDKLIDEDGTLILANLFLAAQKDDDLINLLNWGREQFPDSGDILNFFGYQVAVMEVQSYYDIARESLLKAINQSPDNAMYWDSLAWLYYRMSLFDEAEEAMENTHKLISSHKEIAYHLGAILFAKNEYKDALFYLELAMELKGDEEVHNKIIGLIERIELISKEE